MGDDLTTLSSVKRWLGLTGTSDDDLLAALITSVSRAILADLGRPSLLPAVYTQRLDAAAHPLLRQWPVTRIVSCVVDGRVLGLSAAVGQSGVAIEDDAAAPPGAPQRLFYRGGTFPYGGEVIVTYQAGYQVTAEAGQVPTSAPYIVPVLAPYGAWASDVAVSGAAGSYTAGNGLYTFTARDAGAAVALTYGFVPADVAQAAIEWVADRYMARGRIGQSSKTLGGQETVAFIVKAMPDLVARLLQPYRRVTQP